MIQHLQLKNFKAWRDSGLVRLAPVTMLLGSNSSGKSSLLQSLLLLKQTAAAPDRTVHLNLGGDEAHDMVSLGGCCGTTPDHIGAIAKAVAPVKTRQLFYREPTALA